MSTVTRAIVEAYQSRPINADRAAPAPGTALATRKPNARDMASVGGTSLDNIDRMMKELFAAKTGDRLSAREQVGKMVHWVYVCVSRIADGVAGTPLKLYKMDPQGEEPDEVKDPNHDLNILLARPNPIDTAFEFWYWVMMFLELTGNAVLLRARDAWGTRELWPIPSQYITPKGTPKMGIVAYELDAGGGQAVTIPAADIIHLKYPNPKNRFWGRSRLDAAIDAVDAQDRIRGAQLRTFASQILSTLYFTTEQALSDPAYERMIEIIQERYAGPQNAGKPMLFESGVKPGYLHRGPAEMDFPESAAMTRDEILAVFGVPPILAGIVENANRANSDTQERIFEKATLLPRLMIIQSRFNVDLTPEFGPDLFLEFQSPVKQDANLLINKHSKYMAAGAYEANVVREAEGEEPTEWGEYPEWVWKLMIENKIPEISPAGVQTWIEEQAAAAAELQAQLASGGQDNQPGADPDDGENTEDDPQDLPDTADQDAQADGRAGAGSPAPVACRFTPAKRTAKLDAMRRKVFARTQKDFDELERGTVRVLRKYFADQAKRVKASVRRLWGDLLPEDEPDDRAVPDTIERRIRLFVVTGNARLYPDGTLIQETGSETLGRLGMHVAGRQCGATGGETRYVTVRNLDPNAEGDLDDWDKAAEELRAKMERRIKAAMKRGADLQAAVLGLDISLDLNSPLAEAWLVAKERDYWRGKVGATTRKQLSEKLAGVMNDGPTLRKLEAAVEEVMAGRIRSSAETIARTEVGGAYNAGHQLFREENGISSKEWFSTIDSRVRRGHKDANGQVVPTGGKFNVGGEMMSHPGDPAATVANIANCRCVAVSVPGEDDEIAPGFD